MKISLYCLLLLSVMVTGCANSPEYNYLVEPTPLTANSTYELESVSVNLILGHGANPGDTQFVDQETMTEQFEAALTEALKGRGILAQDKPADAQLKVQINYERKYNIGGKALNAPSVSHRVNAFSEGKEIANFGYGNYTVEYGMTENIKISAFLWKADGELSDVRKVANIIADDIEDMGQ